VTCRGGLLQPPRAKRPRYNTDNPRPPWAFYSEYKYIEVHDLGTMNIVCDNCGTLHWIEEQISGSSKSRPQFEIYCKRGDVVILVPNKCPIELQYLLRDSAPTYKDFQKNIR
jgi:hypothetical protein